MYRLGIYTYFLREQNEPTEATLLLVDQFYDILN